MAAERFREAGNVFAALVRDYASSHRVPQAAALEAVALARQDRNEESLQRVAVVEDRHLGRLEPALQASLIYEKAWAQRGLKRPEDAAATYRKLLEIDGAGTLRLYGMLELAELEMDAERYEQAIVHLRELRALDASEPLPGDLREQAAYQIGVCHYQLEDHETAAGLLERFLDSYPQSERLPSASLLCGEALFNIGRHERAVERLEPVLERHQDHEAYGPSLLRAGECLAVLQEFDRSEALFARYLERFPESPLWYQATFGVGWARDNRGEPDRAIEAYRKVTDRHQGPTAARAQFQIGECLFAQKQYQEAARELLKVDILYAYPKWSAAAIYEAARCFEELSNPVDARRHFQQVLDEYADTQWAVLATQRLVSG
jgi:TolA-binding protein